MPLGRKKTGHQGAAGFTLVELGVVIAMTGILTALLLPALSTAKEKSRRAVCQCNIRQVFIGLVNYANESQDQDTLPSSADNYGYYHSIELSDETFTNFVADDLSGNSNVLYCPNFNYGTMPLTNQYGHVIGYSYLAGYVETTPKGPDSWVFPQKLFASTPTNKLLADANYWTTTSSTTSPMTIAPHTPSGGATYAAAVARATGANTPVPVSGDPNVSANIGAVGGNIGLMDGSVQWKPIKWLTVYQAASDGSAQAAW